MEWILPILLLRLLWWCEVLSFLSREILKKWYCGQVTWNFLLFWKITLPLPSVALQNFWAHQINSGVTMKEFRVWMFEMCSIKMSFFVLLLSQINCVNTLQLLSWCRIYLMVVTWLRLENYKNCDRIGARPNQNYLFLMVISLKSWISDPILINPKCAWEIKVSLDLQK